MLEIYKLVFYILCIILLMVPIKCLHLSLRQAQEVPDASTTTEDDSQVRPTVVVTDLPQSKIDDALNLDVGSYSTVSFHYERHQWMHSTQLDQCYDDYTKCITSLAAPMAVCLMYSTYHLKSVNTYCDGYFENCRIGYRYWRIVGYGKCYLSDKGYPYLNNY